MFQLSNFVGEDLLLVQPSLRKREYEFRRSEKLLAKMYFPKLLSTTAVVEGLRYKYEIFKPNFWKSDIAIKKISYDLPFATLSTNFFSTKGHIELQNGKIVNLKFGSFKKVCQITGQSEDLLLSIKSKLSFKDKNIVTVEKRSELIDNNPWIIMMAWYLILQTRKNSGVG